MAASNHNKAGSAYIPFRCDMETAEMIGRIASGKKVSKSVILRELVDSGLQSLGYRVGEDQIYELVNMAVKDAIKGPVERLAAISAKGTQVAAANYFMSIYAATLQLPERERQQIEDAAARSRELGIQYLKLDRGRDTDSFLQNGVKDVDEGR